MAQLTVRDALRPPPKPADQTIAEVGGKLKDRLLAKLKREKYVAPVATAAPETAASRIARFYPAGVAALSVGAIAIAAIGLFCWRDPHANGMTIGIALPAAAFERVATAIGVTIAFLFLAWLFGTLGCA